MLDRTHADRGFGAGDRWADEAAGRRLDVVSSGHSVELQYFPDCPNWQVAAQRLHDVAQRRGLDVVLRVVDSDDEAQRVGFHGSPTILIDGHDPFVVGDEPVGLSCRLYATPDGMQGAPTVEQLDAVLD